MTLSRRLLRWTLLLALVLVMLFAAFIIERLSWLPRSISPLSGTSTVDGVSSEVRIVRDRNDVPHISGGNTNDIYFGLGFAHAQDRLWQMAFYRRALEGRLSEIVGPSAVKLDTFARALDLDGRARDCLKHLAPKTQAALSAYTAGVNAWVEAHRANLPPEFHLLMTGFEPWEPEHSVLMMKFMAMDLSGNAPSEVRRARLIELLGAVRAGELFPPPRAGDPVTLTEADLGPHAALLGADPWIDRLTRLGGASNDWVVDGRFTKSGKPLLANDPHLGLSAPGIWYLVHLAFPSGDLVGGTIPGIPAIILGHNGHIAWGLTTAEVDTEDLVIETLNPDDRSRYLTPNGSEPFLKRKVAIKVRLGETRHVTVEATRHGPVLPPIFPALVQATPKNAVMALAATGLSRTDTTMDAAIGIASAHNISTYGAAMTMFQVPMQNIVYADTTGNIGYMAPALAPIRGPNAPKGSLVPADGRIQDPLWTGYIPYSDLPHLFNPSSGRIYTANNKIVPDDYPYFLAGDWPPAYRARRIRALLSTGAPWDLADMSRMQMDNFAPDAAELVPLLLRAKVSGERETAAAKLLSKWNFEMAGSRPEPLLYIAWATELQHLVTGDELGKLAGEMRALKPAFLTRVLKDEDGMTHWCDDVKTSEVETCDEMSAKALTHALDNLSKLYGADISKWRWDEAHAARFDHQALGGIPLIGGFFNRQIPMDGGPNSLNRGDMSYSPAHPFASVHGAGLRAVYDLSDLSKSRFMIEIGQSGNPLSPHYDDYMKDWARGASFEIPVDEKTYTAGALGTWVLKPRGAGHPLFKPSQID